MLPALIALIACDAEPPAPATAPAAPAAPVAPAPANTANTANTTPPAPAADSQWQQLRADHAEATSFLKSDWNRYNENYHPSYVLDGDPKTAWVEGASDDGVGERITIPLSVLKSARAVKLRIRNGYQKTENLFTANAVPKDVKLTAWSSARATTSEVTLPYETGWQEVTIDLPEGSGLNAVSLEIVSVYPGSKYRDTCISDIEIFVDSDVPYNAAQEDARHKELLAWVGERVDTAKFFASNPASYPFAATQLAESESEATDASVEPAMIGPREALAQLQAQEGWQKLTATRSIPAFPDGLYLTAGLLPLFTPDALSFAPTPEATGHHERKADTEEFDGEVVEMWSSETWRSNYKVSLSASGTPKLVYFWEKDVEHGRGTYETRTDYLASYTDSGELQWVYSLQVGSSEIGPDRREMLYSFVRSGGQITTIERKAILDFGEQDWKEHRAMVSRYAGS
jgi:hypothetical protein